MSGIVPTLGWIVWFYARRYQAEQINKRRADAARELDYHRWKKNGAMINVGNPVDAGQIVPARIVAVWAPAECPTTKIWAESPPNFRMLRLTHPMALAASSTQPGKRTSG